MVAARTLAEQGDAMMSKKRNNRTFSEEEKDEKRPQKEAKEAISYVMERTNSTTSTVSIGASSISTDHSSTLGLESDTTGMPVNFGVIVPGVYRCSYPKASDYAFLESLKLKTVVTLVDKDLPDSYRPFLEKNGIRHHVIQMMGTKKEAIPIGIMKSILRLVLEQKNYPLLIHCNHGKHRTGCVVGVVRKVSGWEVPSIIDEYKTYAQPKVRDVDVEYITNFDLMSLSNLFSERKRERTVHSRVRHYLRNVLVSFFVLLIWLISAQRMTASQPDGGRIHDGSSPSS